MDVLNSISVDLFFHICPHIDNISAFLGHFRRCAACRTCVKDVQYESTFLTVMTPRLFAVDAFKKQCYMKVNRAIK